MGNPPGRSRFPPQMHRLRPPDHGGPEAGGEEHAGAEEKRRVRESVRRKKKKFITFSEKVSSEKKSQAIFFGKYC